MSSTPFHAQSDRHELNKERAIDRLGYGDFERAPSLRSALMQSVATPAKFYSCESDSP